MGHLFEAWSDLGSFATRMVCISFAEKAAPARSSLKKNSVAARIRRAVCDAVLDDVDIHAGPRGPREGFPRCPLNDFLNGEIRLRGLLTVQQSGGYPDFVGYLEAGLGNYGHAKTSFGEESSYDFRYGALAAIL
jgi:hypothetical protein